MKLKNLRKEFDDISSFGCLNLYHSFIAIKCFDLLFDEKSTKEDKIGALDDLFKICNIASLSENCKIKIEHKAKIYELFFQLNEFFK